MMSLPGKRQARPAGGVSATSQSAIVGPRLDERFVQPWRDFARQYVQRLPKGNKNRSTIVLTSGITLMVKGAMYTSVVFKKGDEMWFPDQRSYQSRFTGTQPIRNENVAVVTTSQPSRDGGEALYVITLTYDETYKQVRVQRSIKKSE